MSVTHGGPNKGKRFQWTYDPVSRRLTITNEANRRHSYSLQEIKHILQAIYSDFRKGYFPLAINVERLSNGTEKNGLGLIILKQKPNDISHAQGSSYLGVVLEECGFLEWNGTHKGIEWRLRESDFPLNMIASRLARR